MFDKIRLKLMRKTYDVLFSSGITYSYFFDK